MKIFETDPRLTDYDTLLKNIRGLKEKEGKSVQKTLALKSLSNCKSLSNLKSLSNHSLLNHIPSLFRLFTFSCLIIVLISLAVHTGANLEFAIDTCLGYSAMGNDFMKGVRVNLIGALPSRLQEYLSIVKMHVEDKNIGLVMEKLFWSRIELRPLLLSYNERLKDLIFLDLALDSAVRTTMERGLKELRSTDIPGIMFFISLMLQNLCLSTVDNEDLIYCTKVPIITEPPSTSSIGMLEIFEGGIYSVIRRAVIIGNGFSGAKNQSIGLVRALGLSNHQSFYVSSNFIPILVVTNELSLTIFSMQRVTRPRGGINDWLHWLPLSLHKKLDYIPRRIMLFVAGLSDVLVMLAYLSQPDQRVLNFKMGQEVYTKEEIDWSYIEYVDNLCHSNYLVHCFSLGAHVEQGNGVHRNCTVKVSSTTHCRWSTGPA
ncbi:hypothetical protein IFM89_006262 [Coptis chinensis]|uniref:Uncharacterized protein n=1 Tax=Coptis chinensis TaxID=261450 RepID=A0A835GXY0_9MAGN|nr:hypothetical protein IFM89_006262 [Coptis chinensis]